MTPERREELFDEMLTWISEMVSGDEELFNTLHNVIGMTKEELEENSFDNLLEYFDEDQSQDMELSQ